MPPDVESWIRPPKTTAWFERTGRPGLVVTPDRETADQLADVYGKIEEGPIIGDNLSTAIFAKSGNGVVHDAAVRDLPVVREVVLFMAAAVVAVNFLVDLAYAGLDPRVRLQ